MWIEPVVLEGRHVRLEPLRQRHVPALWAVGDDPDIWTWLPYTIDSEDRMRGYVERFLGYEAAGTGLGFAIMARGRIPGEDTTEAVAPGPGGQEVGADGGAGDETSSPRNREQLVGATAYMNAEREHRRLEIGATWIAPRWQRTAVNTEAKFLLLRHAFEEFGCGRVEFKTDARNERSQRALERLGCVREGQLRNHMVCDDGTTRDSVYYSIVDDEWPEVRERLLGLLERGGR